MHNRVLRSNFILNTVRFPHTAQLNGSNEPLLNLYFCRSRSLKPLRPCRIACRRRWSLSWSRAFSFDFLTIVELLCTTEPVYIAKVSTLRGRCARDVLCSGAFHGSTVGRWDSVVSYTLASFAAVSMLPNHATIETLLLPHR